MMWWLLAMGTYVAACYIWGLTMAVRLARMTRKRQLLVNRHQSLPFIPRAPGPQHDEDAHRAAA